MAGSLSRDQREHFKRQGYLAPLIALSEAEAGDRLAALTAFEHAGGSFGLRLRFKAHLRLAALMSIVRHPRILDAVESLIGPDILLFTSTLWPKKPGDRRFVSWHQDSAYFGLDPHGEVTAWIALLRAVNVGGTGKLAMSELKAMCEASGFASVKTYIASGNVVFRSGKS